MISKGISPLVIGVLILFLVVLGFGLFYYYNTGTITRNLGGPGLGGPYHNTALLNPTVLNVSVSPDVAPEGSTFTITARLFNGKNLPIPNEPISINITDVNFDPMNSFYPISKSYQNYTDGNGEVSVTFDTPKLPSDTSSAGFSVNVFWKNQTGTGSASSQSGFSIYSTAPAKPLQDLGLWPSCINKVSQPCNILATIFTTEVGGTLYNLGPINFEIIQGGNIASLSSSTAYTNVAGQASDTLTATTPGIVVVEATYQNISKTVNETFIPSQIPLLPPSPYVLNIDATPNPSPSGSNVTIIATLINNGVPMPNEKVMFYEVSATNIVGSGLPTLYNWKTQTDSQGIVKTNLYATRPGNDVIAVIWGDYSAIVNVVFQ